MASKRSKGVSNISKDVQNNYALLSGITPTGKKIPDSLKRFIEAAPTSTTDQSSVDPKNNLAWKSFIYSEFRRHAQESDPKKLEELLRIAEEQSIVMEAVRSQDRFRRLMTGDKTTLEDRTKKAAERVGLSIPKPN